MDHNAESVQVIAKTGRFVSKWILCQLKFCPNVSCHSRPDQQYQTNQGYMGNLQLPLSPCSYRILNENTYRKIIVMKNYSLSLDDINYDCKFLTKLTSGHVFAGKFSACV